jgi:hypothetical protein
MQLDLTDEEAAALLRELNSIIENDRYPLSPRIRTLRSIRAKFPAARPPPPPARPPTPEGVDVEAILNDLYASEINASISWDWGWWNTTLGGSP